MLVSSYLLYLGVKLSEGYILILNLLVIWSTIASIYCLDKFALRLYR